MLLIISPPSRESPCPRAGAPSHQLQFDDIDSLGAFRALFGIKADLVTLGKALEAITLDGSMVDKSFGSIVIRDESETFTVIEPLYCAISHFVYLLISGLKSQKVLAIKKATKSKVFVALAGKNFQNLKHSLAWRRIIIQGAKKSLSKEIVSFGMSLRLLPVI
jgi:hypothetical protein